MAVDQTPLRLQQSATGEEECWEARTSSSRCSRLMFHRKRSGSKGAAGKRREEPGSKPLGVKQAAQKPAQKGKHASAKNQIRSVNRLLQKVRGNRYRLLAAARLTCPWWGAHRARLSPAQGGLEPQAVAAQQKRLQELKDSLVENKTSEKARKYAIRYHKVRAGIAKAGSVQAALRGRKRHACMGWPSLIS